VRYDHYEADRSDLRRDNCFLTWEVNLSEACLLTLATIPKPAEERKQRQRKMVAVCLICIMVGRFCRWSNTGKEEKVISGKQVSTEYSSYVPGSLRYRELVLVAQF
jgi:hypothetical protein